METPYFFSSVAQSLVFVINRVRTVLRAFPAVLPFIPAFAIVIRTDVVSSTDILNFPAVDATSLYASPSASVVVLEFA